MHTTRSLRLITIIMLVIVVPTRASADAWQRLQDERDACEGHSCTLCGSSFHCEPGSQTCSWGAIRFDPLKEQEALDKGVLLYCLGSGGVVLTGASAVGVQTSTLSRTFEVLQRRAEMRPRRSAGGFFEVNNVGGGDKIVGVTIPLSWTFVLDSRSDIDAQGNVIVGGGGGVYQYGLNVNPIYSRFVYGQGSDSWKVVAGGSVPFQMVGTSGEDLETGLSWLVGLGGGSPSTCATPAGSPRRCSSPCVAPTISPASAPGSISS